MLERLVVRPELAAFEPAIRERFEKVAALDDERIARPRSMERDGDGALVVVSEFVPGTRLDDLLLLAQDQAVVGGVDVALGFLQDVLPALVAFHASAGFAHGAIAATRITVTPAGQIVLLDGCFSGALSHLHYTRKRLCAEFGIAMPLSAGVHRFDAASDIAQVTLAASMLVLGRPLRDYECLDGLPNVMSEVVDVAAIRSTTAFAQAMQQFLQRALPLPARKPYTTADDALIDLREIVRLLGVDNCRPALTDFLQQVESASGGQPVVSAAPPSYFDESLTADSFEVVDQPRDDYGADVTARQEPEEDEEPGEEINLDVPSLVEGAAPVEESAAPKFDDFSSFLDRVAQEAVNQHVPAAPEPVAFAEPEPDPEPAPAPVAEPEVFAAPEPIAPAVSVRESAPVVDEAPVPVALAPAAQPPDSQPADADADQEQEESGGGWRRRRQRNKSARWRKDKLRSVAPPPASLTKPETKAEPKIELKPEPKPEPIKARDPIPVSARPEPVEPPPPPKRSWLIPPDKAASFEPPVPIAAAPEPHARPVAPPPIPVYVPPPAPAPFIEPPAAAVVPHLPPPVVPPVLPPVAITPAAPIPVSAPPATAPAPSVMAPGPIKLKSDAAGTSTRPQKAAAPPPPSIYDAPIAKAPEPSSRKFASWQIAAAAVILLGGGYAATQFRPAKTPSAPATQTAPRSTPSARPTATSAPAAAATGAAAANTGRLEIESQPAGAQVQLDGKDVGQTPLKLDAVAAGRHTITLTSAAGTVKRTVRIEAGRTATVDVPIFSGFLGVYAPIVLEVSEGGRAIGTTEQGRLMLPPGRHELTLTNRELGYSTTQTVDIEPGEVKGVTLDPRGAVSFNAVPWAEVWSEGQKIGDTPIGNMQLPLGIREFVFKHPTYGERKVTITVKGGEPIAASVDFTK